MAKFRNIFKRRSRITGIKKISQLAQPQTAQVDPLGEVGKALEEYYSAHPVVEHDHLEEARPLEDATKISGEVIREKENVAVFSQMFQTKFEPVEVPREPSRTDVFGLAYFRFRMFFAWLWVSVRYKPYYAWLRLIYPNREQSRP